MLKNYSTNLNLRTLFNILAFKNEFNNLNVKKFNTLILGMMFNNLNSNTIFNNLSVNKFNIMSLKKLQHDC